MRRKWWHRQEFKVSTHSKSPQNYQHEHILSLSITWTNCPLWGFNREKYADFRLNPIMHAQTSLPRLDSQKRRTQRNLDLHGRHSSRYQNTGRYCPGKYMKILKWQVRLILTTPKCTSWMPKLKCPQLNDTWVTLSPINNEKETKGQQKTTQPNQMQSKPCSLTHPW